MENNSDIDLILENKNLLREFTAKGLNPEKVCRLDPEDMVRANLQLKNLLDWVNAYQNFKNRDLMEKHGFEFPPIDPDYDPDSDWEIFERWIKGEATEFKIGPREEFFKENIDDLSDQDIADELNYLADLLQQHGVHIDILDRNIPKKLVYKYLRDTLPEDSFPFLCGGGWHLDGCDGCCPDCFQRPWCSCGQENKWPEDIKAGKMALPECLKDYACATPFSLKLMEE